MPCLYVSLSPQHEIINNDKKIVTMCSQINKKKACKMGCGEKVPPVEEPAHDAICQAKIVSCTAADVGCTVTVPRKASDDHAKTCTFVSQRTFQLRLQALERENTALKNANTALKNENTALKNANTAVVAPPGRWSTAGRSVLPPLPGGPPQSRPSASPSSTVPRPGTMSKRCTPIFSSYTPLLRCYSFYTPCHRRKSSGLAWPSQTRCFPRYTASSSFSSSFSYLQICLTTPENCIDFESQAQVGPLGQVHLFLGQVPLQGQAQVFPLGQVHLFLGQVPLQGQA